MRIALAALIALTALFAPRAAFAQSTAPVNFSITGPGQASPIFPLTGQSSCAVVVYNGPTAGALVPQVASDSSVNIAAGSAIWNTATGVGAGSITTFGNYVGNVAGQGLTAFRVVGSATFAGTAIGSIVCTTASGSSGTVALAPGSTVGLTPGTTVATTDPYSFTSAQTAIAASFVGIAAYNGTGVDALKTAAGYTGLVYPAGLLATAVCGIGTATACQPFIAGSTLNAGFNAASFPGYPVAAGLTLGVAAGAAVYAIGTDTWTRGPLYTTAGGQFTVSCASAANCVVKASAGRIARLLVTVIGAGTFTCYDNAAAASGTIIAVLGASAALGSVEAPDMPAVNGVFCVSATSGPVVTVSSY